MRIGDARPSRRLRPASLCAAALALACAVTAAPAHATTRHTTARTGTAWAVPVGAPAVPVGASMRTAPKVHARAALLVDAATGEELYARRAGRRAPVASLVKVMTAYVVLREARLSDVIKITKADVRHAVRHGATRAGLRAGERFTVRDLLYALMLPSGADASHALARRYGPGTGRFVAKMNAVARELGLRDTRYANPDGLPHPANGGRSTARDQVRLARFALRHPELSRIAATGRHTVRRTEAHRAHVWRNTNELLGSLPGALGVKTGYTRAAGFCLLFAARREGRVLIGAVLGESRSDRRFSTARRLVEWAGGVR
ncbi:D-alanyl-D-alanine carboxypeptidase family protein [Thermostaphylospora chromogena]|nr:D-alanyl-D-alanine carboxypeptidase family protein [Thermostaphylospora chromogena]